MKTFAINLEKYPEKKTHILKECLNHNIDVEVINAVEGKRLTEEEIKSLVYDYPACLLTKGEIGCVLSHQSVYKKIIDENIPLALVLEDDATLLPGINDILHEITRLNQGSEARVYLLSQVESYIENNKLTGTTHHFHHVFAAFGTHGYVINYKAAQKFLVASRPIIFEADMWQNFHMWYGLNIYCVLPHVIGEKDAGKAFSSIEAERKLLAGGRRAYRHRVKKTIKHYQLKRILHHFFKSPFWIIKKVA